MPRILFSSRYRDVYFYGRLRSRFDHWFKSAYCRPLKKWYAYVYVPRLKRQFCLDVWL